MALGKKCKSFSAPSKLVINGDDCLELGLVRYSRSFRRKRIVISGDFDSVSNSPSKKLCGSADMDVTSSSSFLEALPFDLLVKILCGVDHEDLNQISRVSKMIREATLIAKKCHFAYNTPKKFRPFRTAMDLDRSDFDEIEAPNAPKQSRPVKSRLFGKKFDGVAVTLFD